MKKALFVLLVLTLALSIHASALPEVIAESPVEIQSLAFFASVAISVPDESAHIEVSGVYWSEPFRLKGMVTLHDDSWSQNANFYGEVTEQEQVLYIEMDDAWYKSASAYDGSSAPLDSEMMRVYESAFEDSILDSKEEPWPEPIQGKEVSKQTITVDILSLLDAFDVLQAFEAAAPSLARARQQQELPPIRCSIYTEAVTGDFVRFEMDMSAFVSTVTKYREESMPYTGIYLVVDVWDINAVPEFDIPDEVRAAISM